MGQLAVRAILCSLLASPCLAQSAMPYQAESNWHSVCDKSLAQPITPPEPAGPITPSQLPHCDETQLYYGLGNPPNYQAALQCGWYQRAHPQTSSGNMFYGPGVLTMLYANGLAVPRNYDLAIRFACENQWAAEAEMEYRIGHLESLRDGAQPAKPFDLCDDVTSGLSDGTCTNIRTSTRDTQRDRSIAALVATLPQAARAAFPALQAAEADFEEARVRNEVDLSGTSRAAFALEEQAKLRDQFLNNLQHFSRGDIPAVSAQELSALDLRLNQTFQQLQQAPAARWQYGTVKPDGIRQTERKWVSMDDAWVAFFRIAWPNLSETSLRGELIRLRLHQLRSLAGN
jgi:hypothetical protein